MSEMHGQCHRCQAPVFLNRTVDWYGNSVVTLNCWNGHYQWVHIEDIEEIPPEPLASVKVEIRRSAVTHIGFFKVT